jgi:NAD(P)-dependent dehydrogenase (short-subunit alcohol dehydrogenase family)
VTTAPLRVVVAGGTGALGRAVVELLLGRGDRVAVPYRSREGFDRMKTGLPAPDALWGAQAEIATTTGARAFLDAAAAALGGIDGIAIVAGAYAGSGPVGEADEDEWPSMMRANLETTHAVCRAAIPHLVTHGGSVVTVASRLIESGGAGSAAYVVSKAGVAALTRVLSLEYRARGIRFNCIAPGTIDTPDNRKAMPQADRSSWTPPDAIARVIAFLLSPSSSPVSGAYVPVDGR